MLVRHMPAVLFSIVLVAVSVLAIPLLPFAKGGNYGEEQGEICVPGELDEGQLQVSGPVFVNPGQTVRETTYTLEDVMGDSACESHWCPGPPCVLAEQNFKHISVETVQTETLLNGVWGLATEVTTTTSWGKYLVCD